MYPVFMYQWSVQCGSAFGVQRVVQRSACGSMRVIGRGVMCKGEERREGSDGGRTRKTDAKGNERRMGERKGALTRKGRKGEERHGGEVREGSADARAKGKGATGREKGAPKRVG